MNPFALAAAVSLVASLLLIPVAGLIARQLGMVVKPRRDRWGQREIPTLGGLGIAAAIGLGLLVGPLPDLDRWAIIAVGAVMVGVDARKSMSRTASQQPTKPSSGVGSVSSYSTCFDGEVARQASYGLSSI